VLAYGLRVYCKRLRIKDLLTGVWR